MTTERNPVYIYALADGAQHPLLIGDLMREAAEHRNVYAGLPEEDAGDASLFVAHIIDADEPWLARLDELDLQAPCMTLLWSRVGIDALATHLRQFLVADLGGGVSAMVRYFDPRNLHTVTALWGDETTRKLMAPILQWKYRGHEAEWKRLDGPLNGYQVQMAPVAITLNQQQVDDFLAHCEPDQMLAGLVEDGTVPGDGPYLPRFLDFIERYRRVAAWRLTAHADRLGYCQYSYRYGADFDQDPEVRRALEVRMREGGTFDGCMNRVSDYVWNRVLARQADTQTKKNHDDK
ncbi:DUF4123 domain-containing protein [Cupriavidus sp. NPDC089707]|uniref:DUF4123 domain-containing protein n=1 Tax=Cupriavidus sp. NPDC089707 TaxID=3363963 RepID=UPI00382D6D69